MSDILLKQPAFTAGLPRLYIKVDLNWIILKNFKISALTLRFALRDCGNRTHLPFGKCVLFEISCDDIARHISVC